jgi:hypothetical protein
MTGQKGSALVYAFAAMSDSDRELAVNDYFMKEPGIWAGRGAERLGLRGPVLRSQFVALLRNENPTTAKRLTARINTSRQEDGKTISNRQVGYGLGLGIDPVEERWKAGQFRRLIADKGYFQEYFHTQLAQRLIESGYKLRRTDRGCISGRWRASQTERSNYFLREMS